MISLSNLKPNKPKKARKRKGQGSASGNGTYAGRGMNGQNSRSGGGVRLGFEGGQSGFLQKMAKKPGFTNPNRVNTAEVNLSKLEEAYKAGETVSLATLKKKALIHARATKAKILGTGAITKAIKVSGVGMTASAKSAIEKAGGTAGEATEKKEIKAAPKAKKADEK